MAHQIDPAWATSYLKILVTLLVFSLGIPSLVYAFNMRDDMRGILARRPGQLLKVYLRIFHRLPYWVYTACILFAFILLLIWIFHPCPQNVLSPSASIWASTIMSVGIAISILTLPLHFLMKPRAQLISMLKDEIERKFADTSVIDENVVAELVILGEHADPGTDKDAILGCLFDIAMFVLLSSHYDGRSLELIIKGTASICSSSNKLANERNIRIALNNLQVICNNISSAGKIESKDFYTAIERLIQLSEIASQRGYMREALDSVRDMSLHSEALFRIGITSLNAKKWLVCLAALTNLENRVKQYNNSTADNQTISKEKHEQAEHYLIGLLAHFISAGGAAARRAEVFLEQNEKEWKSTISDHIRSAKDFHFQTANWDTYMALEILENRERVVKQ